MINFANLSYSDLSCIGIRFETQEETNAFIDIIRKEYEARVKKAIARSRRIVEAKAYNTMFETKEKKEAWINESMRIKQDKVIREVEEQLERELIKNKNKIPGTIYCPPRIDKNCHDYFAPEEKPANDHVTDPKGIPAYLQRKEAALSSSTSAIDLSKTNDNGIPLYLQKKEKQKFASIDDVINSLSGKTFPINRRGYDILEVHNFLERLIAKIKQSPIDERIIEDIENVEFGIGYTAYDPKEVDEYLDAICEALEKIKK